MADKTLAKILQQRCDDLFMIQAEQDPAVIQDAELGIIVTAMMLCGYVIDEDSGRYVKPSSNA